MAAKNYTDEDLVSLLKQGDETAFELLYYRYADDLLTYAASRLASLHEAEDIVHDLFVYLWKEKENISVKISVRAFLFSAVKYRIIDHIRKNITRQKYRDQLASLNPLLPKAIEQLDAKDLQLNLDTAINNLSPRVQQVFQMSRYEKLTVKEIADKLGTSERTVKNQLTTALAYLRERLGALIVLLINF